MKSYKKKKNHMANLFISFGASQFILAKILFFCSCDLVFLPFLLACNNFIFPTIEQPERKIPASYLKKKKARKMEMGDNNSMG